MKKSMLRIAMIGLVLFIGMSAIGQEDAKAAKARKDVTDAKQDLKEAKIDSAEDYQRFKKEADKTIDGNKTKIADLKSREATDNKSADEKYAKKVAKLEKQNDDLEKRINGSDKTKTSKWDAFKKEFNHDMDELGHALRDIGKTNT